MRLDHLLSREKAEAERWTPKPRSIDWLTPVVIKKLQRSKTERQRTFEKELSCSLQRAKNSVSSSRLAELALSTRTLTTAQQRNKIQERPVKGKTILLELVSGSRTTRNQATKSTGWMPWHHTPKKDVASCEKLRGAASRHRSVDIRMGEPGSRRGCHRKMNP